MSYRKKERTKHVHRLHPYMGKFVPKLVEIFLRKYQPKLVYDPFCGSGTTLVEANILGIDSIGTDISVFNTLLSEVKTTGYDIALLEFEINDALSKLDAYRAKFPIGDSNNGLFASKSQYINKWFSVESRKELLCFTFLISKYKYRDLLRVILSRSARSARLVPHFDLDFPKQPQTEPYNCYKHNRMCQPTAGAYKFLVRYSKDTLKRIKEYLQLRTDAKVIVNHSDSRNVKLPNNIDMVFTSCCWG